MSNTLFLLSCLCSTVLLALGGYTMLYAREVQRLEKNIEVIIPARMHSLLHTITILSFLFAIAGLLTTLGFFFFFSR